MIGQAGHAFSPDQADLNALIVLPVRHDRRKAAIGKIDMLDHLVPTLKLLWNGEIDSFKVRSKQRKVRCREARQDLVFGLCSGKWRP